jgi:hypothetical protein
MPVLSQWYAGVVRQSSGSRMMSLEPMPECRKPCLWLVESSVPPASEKYSPPERLVGMVMSGTVGCLTSVGGAVLSSEYCASCSGEVMVFARHCVMLVDGAVLEACGMALPVR